MLASSKRKDYQDIESDDRKYKKRKVDKKESGGNHVVDSKQHFGYSNQDNPFGDADLSSSFDWKLKRDQEKKNRKNGDNARDQRRNDKDEMKKRDEETLRKEIEKLKKQREDRDKQKKLWEEERERQARLRDQSSFAELARKEDEFYLSQSKMRALMRVKENRAKPIDYLYLAVNMTDELALDTIIYSPAIVLQPLSMVELEEVLEEIRVFIELDSHIDYWKALVLLISNRLTELKQKSFEYADDGAVHSAIVGDIDDILENKSEKELKELELEIESHIQKREGLDEEYWQSLLKRLHIKKAFAKVDETHRTLVEERLKQLTAIEKVTPEKIDSLRKRMRDITNKEHPIEDEDDRRTNTDDDKPIRAPNGIVRAIRKTLTEDEMYELEEAKGMEEDEEKFSQEFLLEEPGDVKVRRKKPKYFNRVKTGYEWNKYNQVHYDLDSPPPKVVQGYKFNIFYPEIADKSKPPTYVIRRTENPDLVILHFMAGLPYKDIAFKIVNGEWEYSQKAGFRCMFSNGILHLWFNFKRYRYRR